ncbi:MAG: hypothetical protein JXL84_03520 [Deltaproteobacteria bacterium]|nr:hypothetical protein [Deltaproteobacteria bacterium]
MEYYLPVLILAAALAVYFLLRKPGMKDPPRDLYVCDVCGKKDCICHKEAPH